MIARSMAKKEEIAAVMIRDTDCIYQKHQESRCFIPVRIQY